MPNFGCVRILRVALLSAIFLSGCASPTLHSMSDALPSREELAMTVDTAFSGNADEFIRSTFYREQRTWSGAEAIWVHQMYAERGRTDLLQVLQERGWDVNRPSHESSYQPLRLAIERGSTKAVRSLISVGADPDLLTGPCVRPCMLCPDYNRYLCSSPVALVVLAGHPDMLEPVLRASDTIIWQEIDHDNGLIGPVVTGDQALRVAMDRASEIGRGEAFAAAFSDAGHGEQAADSMHEDAVPVAPATQTATAPPPPVAPVARAEGAAADRGNEDEPPPPPESQPTQAESAQDEPTRPLAEQAAEQALETQTAATPSRGAEAEQASSADVSVQSDHFFGPQMPYRTARVFCRERGMRLPTLGEAEARLAALETESTWEVNSPWGIWTETESARNENLVLLRGGRAVSTFHIDPHFGVCVP